MRMVGTAGRGAGRCIEGSYKAGDRGEERSQPHPGPTGGTSRRAEGTEGADVELALAYLEG
jgi:hypothetical protein